MSYAIAGDFILPMKSYVVVQMEKSQELAWVCRDSKELVACLPETGPGMCAGQPLVTLAACNRTVISKKRPLRSPAKKRGN